MPRTLGVVIFVVAMVVIWAMVVTYYSPYQRCLRTYIRENPGPGAVDAASIECQGIPVLN